jgi:DNA-binding IclR family transcriptional regulator
LAGDSAKLDRIIAETRAIGMARTDSLLNSGFTALSAPVLSHDGTLAAAITIIGPSGQMDADFSGSGAVRLRQAASSISGELGLKPS